MLQGSVEEFLDQVARRGSWIGGGSVAALGAALSAALLEKLVHQPSLVRRLRRIRRECANLVQRDADAFACVIQATRAKDRRAFQRTLKAAIEIPVRVFEHARAVRAVCRQVQRAVNPRFHSDLQCACTLAEAAEGASRGFITTNLAWLNNRAYARRVRSRLRAAAR